jgi:hypothetical protein
VSRQPQATRLDGSAVAGPFTCVNGPERYHRVSTASRPMRCRNFKLYEGRSRHVRSRRSPTCLTHRGHVKPLAAPSSAGTVRREVLVARDEEVSPLVGPRGRPRFRKRCDAKRPGPGFCCWKVIADSARGAVGTDCTARSLRWDRCPQYDGLFSVRDRGSCRDSVHRDSTMSDISALNGSSETQGVGGECRGRKLTRLS